MRNVFLALLFANLAYWAWSQWVAVPPPPPVNESITRLPRLKLQDEVPRAKPAPAAATRTALDDSPACLSVGPFANGDSSARAVAQLRAKGFEPRQREASGALSDAYVVSIGAIRSESAASRALHKLQRNGLMDAALVADGADARQRVSLGAFSERAAAERRAAVARGLGFKVEIAESRNVAYWVDLSAPQGTGAVPLRELFAEGVDSRISVQPCPAPTSAGIAPVNSAPLTATELAGAPKLP